MAQPSNSNVSAESLSEWIKEIESHGRDEREGSQIPESEETPSQSTCDGKTS